MSPRCPCCHMAVHCPSSRYVTWSVNNLLVCCIFHPFVANLPYLMWLHKDPSNCYNRGNEIGCKLSLKAMGVLMKGDYLYSTPFYDRMTLSPPPSLWFCSLHGLFPGCHIMVAYCPFSQPMMTCLQKWTLRAAGSMSPCGPQKSHTQRSLFKGCSLATVSRKFCLPSPLSLTELSTSEGTFREHLCFQGLIRTLPVYFILCVMQ